MGRKTRFQREVKHQQNTAKFQKDYEKVMSIIMSMRLGLRFRLAMRLIFKGKELKQPVKG